MKLIVLLVLVLLSAPMCLAEPRGTGRRRSGGGQYRKIIVSKF
uniref:Uncharacterized protein n=1 Tax=Ciona savignyi TaxID=51511 RepID=H2ZID8_CIOSA